MNIYELLILYLAKLSAFFSNASNKGAGTALPGLIVEKLAPSIIVKLSNQFEKKIFVSGTNGKTSTMRSLFKIFEDNGKVVLANTSGSNMMRGLASLYVKHTSLSGKIKEQIAVLEIEEATLPKLTKIVKPDVIVLTNLYRDQLDAYGELDKTQKYMLEACLNSPESMLVVNMDDPKLKAIVFKTENPIMAYSLGTYQKLFKYEAENGLNIQQYVEVTKRLNENLKATVKDITINIDLSTSSSVLIDGFNLTMKSTLPGIFNIYNALAAICAAMHLGIPVPSSIKSLETIEVPFGRGEAIRVNEGTTLRLFLVKNPAGFNYIINFLSYLNDLTIVFALNDKTADGKDVSWIWDSDFEYIRNKIKLCYTTGTRAYDIALRFKYAEFDLSKLIVYENMGDLLAKFTDPSFSNGTVFILTTYTAMNEIREILSKKFNLRRYE